MGRWLEPDVLPDAVFVSGKVTWAPPVAVGMACKAVAHGFEVIGRIVEVLDPKAGEVMVLADDGQKSTATTGEDGEDGPTTWTLFTPGQPFAASWRVGLFSVQRTDGQWERPVLEVIREKRKAALGWQLSDAVRCDPDYRNKITGGGVRGSGGRFQGRGEGGASVLRQRWTTTLTPEALAVLATLAERHGISRNEVVERMLASYRPLAIATPGGLDSDEAPTVVVSAKVPPSVAASLDAHADSISATRSQALRALLAGFLL